MSTRTVFSDNISIARKRAGYTQKEAAEKIGIKLCTLASYEEARADPSIMTLISMMQLYGLKDLTALATNGSYYPSHCYSGRKQRSRKGLIEVRFNNETKSLRRWCKELGVSYDMARYHIIKGKEPKEVLLKAVEKLK